ncbi:hypothetical protein HYC85_009708 [Camellia sinensis]|uniref:Uncharacterized protein n=1 Tax=Camellia sinensis TaxID=4442 RepID=A0A7J7HIF6_CAMSI|nr:hypothetical protein HYC85_009708 [Camellia sinensis]
MESGPRKLGKVIGATRKDIGEVVDDENDDDEPEWPDPDDEEDQNTPLGNGWFNRTGVDDRCRENYSGREALEYEDHLVVDRLAVEVDVGDSACGGVAAHAEPESRCWVKICIPLWNSWSLRRQRRLLACFWRWMVLHLLESPEALKAKVAEAMEVLKNVQQQQASNPADQLASLSLNDRLVS